MKTLTDFLVEKNAMHAILLPEKPFQPCGCLRCTICLSLLVQDIGHVFGWPQNMN